jgi:hypothetical protein
MYNYIEKGCEVVTKYLYNGAKNVGFNLNGVQYFYVKNLQGDVTKVIDDAGEIVNSYSYDAWRSIVDIYEEVPQPIRYRGYYYALDAVNGNNIFAYCLNAPINLIDSSGEKAKKIAPFSLAYATDYYYNFYWTVIRGEITEEQLRNNTMRETILAEQLRFCLIAVSKQLSTQNPY